MYQSTGESDVSGRTITIVTINKLQVGFRIMANELQANLASLVKEADTTPQGSFGLLQTVSGLFLTYSDFWSHVLAGTYTVASQEIGDQLFSQISATERNKIRAAAAMSATQEDQENVQLPVLSDKPSYVVSTLLVGIEGDRSLFGEIYSVSRLRDVLQEVTFSRPLEIRAFDLLWSPSLGPDKLTEEELQLEYGDLNQIA